MRSRYLLYVVTLLVVAISALSAQPRMRSPEEQAKQLKDRLSLSDEQTADITVILKEQRAKMEKLRGSAEPGPGMRESFQKLSAETDAEILKILDEDQQKEYKKLAEERRQNMRERRRPE